MIKRSLGGALWFCAGWVIFGALLGMAGLPNDIGIVFGLAVGGFVLWDPTGHLWTVQARGRRRIRPINEVAAELDARASLAPSAEGEHAPR